MAKIMTHGSSNKSKVIVLTAFYIIVIDLCCIFLLLWPIHNDINVPDSVAQSYNSMELLSFDVVIQIISLVAACLFPLFERRIFSQYNISKEDFQTLEDKNNTSAYLNLLACSIGLIVLDAFAYTYQWKYTLLAILIVTIVLIIAFLFWPTMNIIFPRAHIIRTVRSKCKYYFGTKFPSSSNQKENALPRFVNRSSEYYVKDTPIMSQMLLDLFIQMGFDEMVKKFQGRNKNSWKNRDNTIYYLSCIHIKLINSLSTNDLSLNENSSLTQIYQIKTLIRNNSKIIENVLNFSTVSPSLKNQLLNQTGESYYYLTNILDIVCDNPNVAHNCHEFIAVEVSKTWNDVGDTLETPKCVPLLNVVFSFLMKSIENNDTHFFEVVKASSSNSMFRQPRNNLLALFIDILTFNLIARKNDCIFMNTKQHIKEIMRGSWYESIGSMIGPIDFNVRHYFELYANLLIFSLYAYENRFHNSWYLGADSFATFPFVLKNAISITDIYKYWIFFLLYFSGFYPQHFKFVFSMLPYKNQKEVIDFLHGNPPNFFKNEVDDFISIIKYLALSDENGDIDFSDNELMKQYSELVDSCSELIGLSLNSKNIYDSYHIEKHLNKLTKSIIQQAGEFYDKNISLNHLYSHYCGEYNIVISNSDKGEITFLSKEDIDKIKNAIFKDCFENFFENMNDDFHFESLKGKNVEEQVRKQFLSSLKKNKVVYKHAPMFDKILQNINMSSKEKNIVSKLKDSPVPISCKLDSDIFFTKNSIKFNIELDKELTHVRPLAYDEILKILDSLKRKGDNYIYNGNEYSHENIFKTIQTSAYKVMIFYKVHFVVSGDEIYLVFFQKTDDK